MRIGRLFHSTFIALSYSLSITAAADDAAQSHEFTLPAGFSSQRIAGPPLVTHPTMGCFDDVGRFFVCDGAGVNMSAAELEEHLPNHIKMLVDQDGDGTFDTSTVFADRMTFPMGAAWHDGALFVASPPNIWRLEDTTGDGVADKRDIIVDSFGYTGNAASIHGCFFSPDGRMYWCDGYHGHEFKDDDGNITSKRKGSYIFSCRPDGSDVRIHCGGGMDNPVEVDFTEEGDVIGTVNILYNRPRSDCLVHWQYGGTYPHRAAVLEELKVTGDLLGPIHNFGHVAVSGTTRYRSGMMDGGWDNSFFVTQFNLGKIVRVELERSGSTYSCVERQFLSCGNRDFHPTDVIEDADGSLVVIDTGGWFYRGCPTSQIAKPDIVGGIYRIRRDDMPVAVDPRGNRINWNDRSIEQLIGDLADKRFAVREKAIQECVRRRDSVIVQLSNAAGNGETITRRNAIWAITRLAQSNRNGPSSETLLRRCRSSLLEALDDANSSVRQTAWHGIGSSHTMRADQLKSLSSYEGTLWQNAVKSLGGKETSAAVRRTAWATLSQLKLPDVPTVAFIDWFLLPPDADREERHALLFALLESAESFATLPDSVDTATLFRNRDSDHELLIVLDQIMTGGLPASILGSGIKSGSAGVLRAAAGIAQRQAHHNGLSDNELHGLYAAAAGRLQKVMASADEAQRTSMVQSLVSAFGKSPDIGAVIADAFQTEESDNPGVVTLLSAIASQSANSLPLHAGWQSSLQSFIHSPSPNVQTLAIQAVRSTGVTPFSKSLRALVDSADQPMATRMEALKTLAADRNAMPQDELFRLLLRLATDGSIEEQLTATGLLSSTSITTDQLRQVAPLLQNAGPGQLVDLVSLFRGSLPAELAVVFLDNIENARSLNTLPTIHVSEVVKRFAPELHDRANALLDRMHAAEQQKLLKLDSLVDQLKSGDASRGKAVFFGKRAKCSTCHVVGQDEAGELLGKRVGPDLTTIGASRTPQDLLESIIFPSSTIVRQYEPYTLVTAAGRTYSGLVLKDTAESVVIQQAAGDPITVDRNDVDELIPATVSIMPKGLDEELSAQQIADLIAWLQSLR